MKQNLKKTGSKTRQCFRQSECFFWYQFTWVILDSLVSHKTVVCEFLLLQFFTVTAITFSPLIEAKWNMVPQNQPGHVYGDSAISYASPMTWNPLPDNLKDTTILLPTFTCQIQTSIFFSYQYTRLKNTRYKFTAVITFIISNSHIYQFNGCLPGKFVLANCPHDPACMC